MTGPTLEKIARAISMSERGTDLWWSEYLDTARAALEAMRDGIPADAPLSHYEVRRYLDTILAGDA